MTMDPLDYGNAMRGRPRVSKKKAVTKEMIAAGERVLMAGSGFWPDRGIMLNAIYEAMEAAKEQDNGNAGQSPQANDGHPPQAPDPGDRGSAAPVAGGITQVPPGYFTQPYVSSILPAAIVIGNSINALAQQNAAQQQANFAGAYAARGLNQASALAWWGAAQETGLDITTLPKEIRPGEIIAWRAWDVDGDPPRLKSVAMGTAWAPGLPLVGDPSTSTQGVHAWKTKAGVLKYIQGMRNKVIGEVELWGTVIEHEDGYRAEYAAVKSLERVHNNVVYSPVPEEILAYLQGVYLEGKPERAPSSIGISPAAAQGYIFPKDQGATRDDGQGEIMAVVMILGACGAVGALTGMVWPVLVMLALSIIMAFCFGFFSK